MTEMQLASRNKKALKQIWWKTFM